MKVKENPKKIKEVKDLADKIKNTKTLMIVSIKNLPSKQFQEIKKSLRDHALIKVFKKNIMLRAIKSLKNDSILKLEKYIEESCAFAISDTEGFELAGILSSKKTPVYAKAGQISPEDIEVKDGPTDLVPGPAISELGALGIQIAVEEGKIVIKKSKVIVNQGETISEGAAAILQKLNIQPFKIGLEPLVIYDSETEKIYADIKINAEEVKENIKDASGKALGFAQKIVYYCKETIGYLLSKANAHGNTLEKLEPKEEIKEEKSEQAEEKKEDSKKGDAEENKGTAKEENVEEKKNEWYCFKRFKSCWG